MGGWVAEQGETGRDREGEAGRDRERQGETEREESQGRVSERQATSFKFRCRESEQASSQYISAAQDVKECCAE